MLQNVTDNDYITILQSNTKKPLALWEKKIRNGHIKRVTDSDVQGMVLELCGNKMNNTYITCPADVRKTLGVKMPVLVAVVKNLSKCFSFDVQILDDNNVRRRFIISSLTINPEVKPFICKLPLFLEEGWNRIIVPLQDFTKRAYGTNYMETLRIQIYPNCRIQKICFTNKESYPDNKPLTAESCDKCKKSL